VAAAGVGALSGALYLASRFSARGLLRLIAIAPALFGSLLLVFSLNRSFPLALVLMPLLGLGQMLLMASCNTVLQTIVDDDKRGRVMSFYSLSFMGVAPLGNLLAGVAAREFGSAATMAVGGVACVLGAIAFTRRLPRLRTLIRPIYASKGIVTDVAAGNRVAASECSGAVNGGGENRTTSPSASQDRPRFVP
jgi:predicted MFS family arabinose efflux permease